MTETRKRTPKGIPTGGEFAANEHDEANASLRGWDDLSLDERKAEVEEKISRTLHAHGIHDWKVRYNAARRTLGSASFKTKTINISTLQFDKGRDVTMDTAMHEAAHVIAGAHAAHGPAWKRVAASLGASTKARHNVDIEREKETRTVSTRYGDLTIEEGVTTMTYEGREYVVKEARNTKLIISDGRGRDVLVPMEMAHPNYGDISKMTNGATKRLPLGGGEYVTATEGKTTFDHGGHQFTVTEIRQKNFVAVDGSGRRFAFPASKLDPMEAKLSAAWDRARQRQRSR